MEWNRRRQDAGAGITTPTRESPAGAPEPCEEVSESVEEVGLDHDCEPEEVGHKPASRCAVCRTPPDRLQTPGDGLPKMALFGRPRSG